MSPALNHPTDLHIRILFAGSGAGHRKRAIIFQAALSDRVAASNLGMGRGRAGEVHRCTAVRRELGEMLPNVGGVNLAKHFNRETTTQEYDAPPWIMRECGMWLPPLE